MCIKGENKLVPYAEEKQEEQAMHEGTADR